MVSSRFAHRRRTRGTAKVCHVAPVPIIVPPAPPPPPELICTITPNDFSMGIYEYMPLQVYPENLDLPDGDPVDALYWTEYGDFHRPNGAANMHIAYAGYVSFDVPGDYKLSVHFIWSDDTHCLAEAIAHVT